MNDTFAATFWHRVDSSAGPAGCWPWTGAKNDDGYGYASVDGRAVRAPRLAWQMTYGGPIPPGLDVLHTCDRPPCCNPAHLFLGDDRVNAAQMARRGRARNGAMGPLIPDPGEGR
jgi:hypothetical protein